MKQTCRALFAKTTGRAAEALARQKLEKAENNTKPHRDALKPYDADIQEEPRSK